MNIFFSIVVLHLRERERERKEGERRGESLLSM
jgi:hypothetical protein